jgi:hypothetical protein
MSAPSTPKRPRPSGLTCPPAPKRMRLSAQPMPEVALPLGVKLVLQELVPRHLQTYIVREIKRIPASSEDDPQIIRHCFLMPDDPESVTSLKMILEMLSPTVRFVRADAGGDSNGNSVLGITFIWQKGAMTGPYTQAH